MACDLGQIIAASGALGVEYAERLVKGISEADFARFARPGGQVISSNHPAFLLGHLSLYGPRIVEQLGGDAGAVRPPAEFESLFSKDATCQDDPEGNLYPPASRITEAFFAGYRAALEILRNTEDQVFLEANPATGPIRDRFPTKGAMHAFYMGGHTMVHLGQLSAWRRMMGLPPA